jgi:uncharacterized protein YbaR (Trm112 family)
MKLTNRLGFPPAFVIAAGSHTYPQKPERIGVTQLIDSPKVRRLTIEKYDSITVDIEDFMVAMLGTAFHGVLEKNRPLYCEVEKKWEYPISQNPPLLLVGKADVVSQDEIRDYKLMSAFSWIFDKDKHFVEQLNILNFLRYKIEGIISKKLIVDCFIKDWSKYQAQKDPDYPQEKYFCREVAVWPMEQTIAFIKDRLKLHLDSAYECTKTDKWIRFGKFAVMEKDKKKAMRLLDTAPEAMAYIEEKGLTDKYSKGTVTIEQRKTEANRCLNCCNCRSVCEYALSLAGAKE